MMTLARYDYLVIPDGDVRVARDYLAKVVAPLHDPRVGIIACSYRGSARAGLWSLLGGGAVSALAMLAITVATRIMLHSTVRNPGAALLQLLIVPVRATLCLAL